MKSLEICIPISSTSASTDLKLLFIFNLSFELFIYLFGDFTGVAASK